MLCPLFHINIPPANSEHIFRSGLFLPIICATEQEIDFHWELEEKAKST